MVDVEKISREYQHANPVGQFKSTAGKFGCDLLELAELQGRLLKADAKSAMHKSLAAALCALIGCVCLLGCTPIVILGIASAAAYYFQIEPWIAQLSAACSFAIMSLAVIAIAARTLSKSGVQFKRSTEEFAKNLAWAKDIFKGVSTQ